ncbi:MAG: hypothetical protein ACKO85_08785 [Isosphaeraceae bacterium]
MNNLTENALAEGTSSADPMVGLPRRNSGPLVIAVWLAPLVVIGAILVATFWFVGSIHEESWVTLFEGRSYDAVLRRRVVHELQQSGVKFRAEADGRIQVLPDTLQLTETSLEKKGLKPESLEEIRGSGGGALAILESPLQRDERIRSQKEKELTWMIRRAGDFRDVQVSLEPVSATRRFINDTATGNVRVRVFLEPLKPGSLVDEKSVEKIRNIVLASISGTTDEHITIHDSENIYILGKNVGPENGAVKNNATHEPPDIKSLENRIKREVSGLSDAIIKIDLASVNEIQPANEIRQPEKTEKPVLYFNEPVSIELKSDPVTEKKVTTRARVAIELPEKAELAPEVKRQAFTRISSVLSPILLEKLDWTQAPPMAIANNAILNKTAQGQPANSLKLTQSAEKEIKLLVKTSSSLREPWVLGAVGAGLVCAILFLRRIFMNSQVAAGASTRPMASNEYQSRWREDLPAHTPQPANPSPNARAMPVDQAAEVLSDWISGSDFNDEAEPDADS